MPAQVRWKDWSRRRYWILLGASLRIEQNRMADKLSLHGLTKVLLEALKLGLEAAQMI